MIECFKNIWLDMVPSIDCFAIPAYANPYASLDNYNRQIIGYCARAVVLAFCPRREWYSNITHWGPVTVEVKNDGKK